MISPTAPREPPLRILVVDDDADIRTQLTLCLEAEGHHVVGHGNVHDAVAEAAWQPFDVVFLDLRPGNDNGLDFLPRLLAESPWTKVIVLPMNGSMDGAVEAVKRGATDYLPKPFSAAQVRLVTQKVAALRMLERKVHAIQLAFGDLDPEGNFPTVSPAMARALELARQAATSSATVLIRGEIGTGKGRLARAIHAWSARAAAPFASVSCQTSAADALDAELFGLAAPRAGAHVDPQDHSRAGRIQYCDGGTLVLEAVSELPPGLQEKVLHLLRHREYERYNEFKPRPANVRVIATTGIDLENLAQRGQFRPELLAALETIKIDLPPLRQRPEDVPLLANRYLAHFARENHRALGGFTEQAMEVLREHLWPGNTRELRNVIERAVLLCKGGMIALEHLPQNLLNSPSAHAVGDLVALETIEELHIRKVVAAMPTIASAAAVLGVHPGTVLRRLKKRGADEGTPAGRPTGDAASSK
jgi:NtrC-family two-component system response regulator AlgB